MGGKHRIARGAAWFCVVACSLAAVGCGDSAADRHAAARRALLRGEDLIKHESEQLAKLRVLSSHGDLLPSDTIVAGIVMPRGYKSKFTFDHEWWYDGQEPIGLLEKYFRARLVSESVEQPDKFATIWEQAKTKGGPDMKPVYLKIYPVPGRSDWSRIVIRAPKPKPDHIPTAEEVAAELAARPNR